MNRRKLAGLIAKQRDKGSPKEAALAAQYLSELIAAGKLSSEEIAAIARESTDGTAAPPVKAPEGWRSTIAAALAAVHGCRAFWRGGSLIFVGGGASAALSAYLRAATEADVWAAASFRLSAPKLPLTPLTPSLLVDPLSLEGAFADPNDAGGLFASLLSVLHLRSPQRLRRQQLHDDERAVAQVQAAREAERAAAILWFDLFRNAFAKAVSEALIGKVDVSTTAPQAPSTAIPVEIEHARALQKKLGSADQVGQIAKRAETLGAAAGSRWRPERKRMLMECRTCREIHETVEALRRERDQAVADRDQALAARDTARKAATVARRAAKSAQKEAAAIMAAMSGIDVGRSDIDLGHGIAGLDGGEIDDDDEVGASVS